MERRVDAPANLAAEHLSYVRQVRVRHVLRAFLVSATVARSTSTSAHICKRVGANCPCSGGVGQWMGRPDRLSPLRQFSGSEHLEKRQLPRLQNDAPGEVSSILEGEVPNGVPYRKVKKRTR